MLTYSSHKHFFLHYAVERLLENLKEKRLIPMSNRGVPGPVPDPSEQRPNMSIPTQNPSMLTTDFLLLLPANESLG